MDEELEVAARARLHLTTSQWHLLRPLIEREAVATEILQGPMAYGTLATHINALRKKLKPHQVTIKNLWGFGYSISPEHKRIILDFLR